MLQSSGRSCSQQVELCEEALSMLTASTFIICRWVVHPSALSMEPDLLGVADPVFVFSVEGLLGCFVGTWRASMTGSAKADRMDADCYNKPQVRPSVTKRTPWSNDDERVKTTG